ncbi:MAG TPA: SPOR domain-containing protein [Longimicrobiales bacterium]
MTAALIAVALVGAPALAQERELDRVESLINAGEYAAARAAIEEWWRAAEDGRDAAAEARARAHLLRARLTPDPRTAERDYLAVALGHPTSSHAAQALLSLGQGLLATGDIARAALYLKRLVDDYPTSPLRPIGQLWLVRTLRIDGATAAACTHARAGTTDAAIAALLRREEAMVCPRLAAGSAAGDGATSPDRAPRADAAAPTPAGRFAVQSGAFRQTRGAHDLADRLRRAGYEPRLVYVPGSSLLRVRLGRFANAAAANALAARLRAAGFAAVVVRDANRERPAN